MELLCDIKVGSLAIVKENKAKSSLKERLLALGVTKGAIIEILRKGPKNNLTLYKIRGAMIALRKEEASLILVDII
ncbi:FeoA family protein [Clostridium tarantellae]|uniref:Ferrous iron transport protein A n=1 Tax=Clostridium tarantellae TaxID=39493 RepID=A0A6I1MPP4_9CLOT|nr:FeoA family protein [Clostridium tarantellae]MPQ44773.1 ferrous iron transport protein A [Clostridium tarantellae]